MRAAKTARGAYPPAIGTMSDPKLVGALQGLKLIEPSDLRIYKQAVEDGQQMGWGYYFPYLLTRNKTNRSAVLLEQDEGSMCVYVWQMRESRPRLDLALAPTPMNPRVLERALMRANEFNGDYSARVLRIDEKDVAAVSTLRNLRVTQRKSQYLFAPKNYVELSGGRYQTIRRQVARAQLHADVTVEPYATAHAHACQVLLQRWRRRYQETNKSAGAVGMSKRGIELAGVLPHADLQGEVVLVDGRVAAFALGGELRPGLGCSFDRRSDPDVSGLSYLHLRSFLLSLHNFEVVNDGSDAGRGGLRQLKDSFRPVAMHAEYRAKQLARR